jgi:hypothetical protein
MPLFLRPLSALLTGVTLSACSLFSSPPPDPLRQASYLSPGLYKEEVRALMGDPAKTEFTPRNDAWHYCRSGKHVNEYAVALFRDGRLTAVRHYNVKPDSAGGSPGPCERAIKPHLFPEKR